VKTICPTTIESIDSLCVEGKFNDARSMIGLAMGLEKGASKGLLGMTARRI
jgi:hypothetical protein